MTRNDFIIISKSHINLNIVNRSHGFLINTLASIPGLNQTIFKSTRYSLNGLIMQKGCNIFRRISKPIDHICHIIDSIANHVFISRNSLYPNRSPLSYVSKFENHQMKEIQIFFISLFS